MAPWPSVEIGDDVSSGVRARVRRSLRRPRRADPAAPRVAARIFGVSALATVMPGRDGWYYWLGEDGLSLDRHYRGVAPFPQTRTSTPPSRNSFAGANGWRRAASPTSSPSFPRNSRSIRNTCRRGSTKSAAAVALRSRGRGAARHRPRRVHRPASRAARGEGTRPRLLQDRLALELQRRDGRLRRDHARRAAPAAAAAACRRSRRRSGRPTCRASTIYSGDLVGMLGLPRADSRGRRRAARARSWPTRRAAAPGASTRGKYPGFEIYACDRPGLPRAVVYRDSMAIPLIPMLAENFSRVVFVSSRRLDPALIEREKPDIVIEEMVERSAATRPARCR